jgi:hypothetical protein
MMKTKLLKFVTFICPLVSLFKMAFDDRCCRTKYLKYKKSLNFNLKETIFKFS